MATSNVIYLGELRTQATHLSSNSNIVTDAPTDNQGKGEAFSPTDLMATSLASCMLTILGIYCKNNSINMTDSNAEITKIMSAKLPRRIVEIKLALPFNNLNGEFHDKFGYFEDKEGNSLSFQGSNNESVN
ncbi:MAG: OsmC family protein, partial [Bacteroidetes bacterium]|nr:OsmC family protein [Bacteroidota bacterium]